MSLAWIMLYKVSEKKIYLTGGMYMTEIIKEEMSSDMIFQLISYSGDARSYIYEAYNTVREGKYEECDSLLEKANEAIIEAHNMQTNLIHKEARGEKVEINLLLVHAQDHLMNTLLAKDLVKNMINMQKEINYLKEKIG